ncbi:6-hydroxymethylpterin diphosphokinase MptE-like protein [Sulfurimonas sp.]|uniref:6-hydroxymethylpterin diphosphokinase MptE-like protein n=1 Tax=Sulfurimonas sp. TaxID=2022749 RepID=UPI003568057F
MQEIESLAIQNYQDNMLYFEKHHQPLYNRLLALETLLDEGRYPQKYDLEYKDGYFDIVELNSGNHLYNENSEKFSNNLANKVTYKKNDHTFISLRKIRFEPVALEALKKENNAYAQYSTTAFLTEYYYNNTDYEMSMKKLDKFIFIGTGLGMHIEKIIKKFDLQVVLIIEDDIELFRLSLFTTNYAKKLNNIFAFFSISETKNEFHTTFNDFYFKAFFKNQYIKFNMFSSAYEHKIDEIRSMLISRPEATYSHERLIVKHKRIIDSLTSHYKYLDITKKENESYFADKPWLVVGAGPSLHKNTDWLVENQDKFIIIAAFTALKTLQRVGVKPDIAVQIDENDFTTDKMLKSIENFDFLDSSVLIFSGSVSKLLFNQFDKEKIYLHEDRTKYKLNRSTLTVASVGETIYSLSLIFNVANIYLLGLDLALGDNGKTHSDDHFMAKTLDQKAEEENDQFQLDNIIKVKGNFRDTVETTNLFAASIPVINRKTQLFKTQNQNIYNLCDGALFENITPLKFNDINIDKKLDKSSMYEELKQIFDKYSTTSLIGTELDAIECRGTQIKDYYNYLTEFENSPHANPDLFLASYIKFASMIVSHKCELELKEIMVIFFLRTSSYIDDFLNTKEIKNHKKYIKKFKTYFIEGTRNILDTFSNDFNRLKNSLEETKE